MLRLIIAAVLATACLAYPQNRDGAPADPANNLQAFVPGMQAMPGMQGMMGMPGGMQGGMQGMPLAMPGQFMPFNSNFGAGFRRDAEEDPEERKSHSVFQDDNESPFDSADNSLGNFNFENFMMENADSLPFANMEGADTADLGNFEPSADHDQQEGHFRFFDNEQ